MLQQKIKKKNPNITLTKTNVYPQTDITVTTFTKNTQQQKGR